MSSEISEGKNKLSMYNSLKKKQLWKSGFKFIYDNKAPSRAGKASTFPLASFQADATSGLCSFPPTWLRSLFLPDCVPGSYKKLMKPVWTWWSNPCYKQRDPVWLSREVGFKFVFSFLVPGSLTFFCTCHAHLGVQVFPLPSRSSPIK